MRSWSAEELEHVGASDELEIATVRADGTLRRRVPVWAVCVGEHVYVRTWYRRDGGWFGRAVRSGRARVRVPGVETDVAVDDVGAGPTGLRAAVDAAYRAKYGRHGGGSVDNMVTDEAAAATLRLTPVRPDVAQTALA